MIKALSSTLRYLGTVVELNVRELGALRMSALIQMLFMFLNNATFFVFWIIVYHNVDSIRGIRLEQMAFIYGVTATSFGISSALFGGTLWLADQVKKGALDIYLTHPRDPFLQLICSRSNVSAWGDALTGLVFIALYFGADLYTWLVFLFTVLTGMAIWIGTITLYQSLVFFLARSEAISYQLFEFLLNFSLYPPSIFPSPVRILAYSLFPGAYIAFYPMLLQTSFSWLLLLSCLAAALGYLLFARCIFMIGLKRYCSGNSLIV